MRAFIFFSFSIRWWCLSFSVDSKHIQTSDKKIHFESLKVIYFPYKLYYYLLMVCNHRSPISIFELNINFAITCACVSISHRLNIPLFSFIPSFFDIHSFYSLLRFFFSSFVDFRRHLILIVSLIFRQYSLRQSTYTINSSKKKTKNIGVRVYSTGIQFDGSLFIGILSQNNIIITQQ